MMLQYWILIAVVSNLFVTVVIFAIDVTLEPPSQDTYDNGSVVVGFAILFFVWPFYVAYRLTTYLTKKILERVKQNRVCPKCKSLY